MAPPEDAVLRPDLDLYWRAWHTLRDDRYYGAFGGAGRIYFIAIDRYATRYGIEDLQFDWLVRLLGAMDEVFIEWLAEKQRKTTDQQGQNTQE